MTNLATVPVELPAIASRGRLAAAPQRAQARRPRIVYAFVAIGGIAIISIAQLLLSVGLSDSAYQISSLQEQQKVLDRTHQSLSEQITTGSSPQSLAQKAAALGMVTNGNPVFLRLSDGAVLGSPAPAAAATPAATDAQGLVPNSLLTPRTVVVAGNSGDPRAPSPATVDPTVPWQGELPTPTTH